MSTNGMNEPRVTARTAGFFWLMTFITGLAALIAGGKLLVAGDAAATAANILGNESMFRLSIAANLVATLCYVAVTVFIYQLFKPVNRSLSLLGAFFSLVGCAVGAFSGVLGIAPLVLLKGSHYASAFNAEQLQAVAHMFATVGAQAGSVGLVFFSFHCLLTGVLILKSRFIPKFAGVLMVLAGAGWLSFLWPPLADSLMPYNMLPGMIGELTLTLWLLVKGVNVERWREQAGTSINLQHALV